MNFYAIIGFIIAAIVFGTGLFLASPNLELFLDYPSMFIVCGGTFAAAAISFQLNRIKIVFAIFLRRVLKGHRINHTDIVKQLIKIADEYRKGGTLSKLAEETEDFFIKESLGLLNDGIVCDSEIIEILEMRNKNLFTDHVSEAGKIKTLGKFPPAFGMIGTTIGMIVLLANLGGEDAMKMIGPAMGVCLITTLYGAVIANLLFIPASENLIESSKEIYLKNEIIIEAVRLISKKTNPVIVAERLNSFLRPGNRLDWKDVLGSSSAHVKAA